MSDDKRHIDQRTGAYVDCWPQRVVADPLRVRCTGPGCGYQASAMSLESLHDAIWAHHVAVHDSRSNPLQPV